MLGRAIDYRVNVTSIVWRTYPIQFNSCENVTSDNFLVFQKEKEEEILRCKAFLSARVLTVFVVAVVIVVVVCESARK